MELLKDVMEAGGGEAGKAMDACRQTGADAWCSNPQKTVEICKSWL